MKKFYRLNKFFLLTTVAIFGFSCQKKALEEKAAPINKPLTDGLPDEFRSINGYINSMYTFPYGGGGFNTISYQSYAGFCDPKKNLLSTFDRAGGNILFSSFEGPNISLGRVFISEDSNFGSSSGANTYRYTNFKSNLSSISTQSTYISTEGNTSFKPISINLERNFPTKLATVPIYTISKSLGFQIDANTFASNYDSVIVRVVSTQQITKRATGTNPVMIFSPKDLEKLSINSSSNILVTAVNFSHMIVDDKVYVFELCTRQTSTYFITP